nr:serine-aspartate repeat-containing protein F-like [Procambarus clarkii]
MYPLLHTRLLLGFLGLVSCARVPDDALKPFMPRTSVDINDPPSTDTALPVASDPPSTDTNLPAASDPPSTDTNLPAASDPPSTVTNLPAASDPPSTDTNLPAASDPPSTDTNLPAASDPPSTVTNLPAASDPPSTDTNLPYHTTTATPDGDENSAKTPGSRLSKASQQLEDPSKRLKKLPSVGGSGGNLTEKTPPNGVSGRGDDEGSVKGEDGGGESDWKSTYDNDDEGETDDDAEYIDLDDAELDHEEEYEYEDDEGDDTDADDTGDEGDNALYSGDGDDDDDDQEESDDDQEESDDDEEHDESEDNNDENEYDGYIQSYWDGDDDDDDNQDHDDEENDNRDFPMDSDEEMVFMYLLGNETSALTPFSSSKDHDSLPVLARDARNTSPETLAVTDDEMGGAGTLAVTEAAKNAEEHLGSQKVSGDGRQTPYLLGDGYVPRSETVIVLTEEQLQHLSDPGTVERASEETEESTGKHEYDEETSIEENTMSTIDYTLISGDNSWQGATNSSAPPSSDATHHYESEVITEEELEELLETYHDFIQTEEEWEGKGEDKTAEESYSGTEGISHAITLTEDTESTQGDTQHLTSPTSLSPSAGNKVNGLKTTSLTSGDPGFSLRNQTSTDLDIQANSPSTVISSLSQTYNDLTKSDQLTVEGKEQLSNLERLRRTVEALGGEDALRRNPNVHHIVRRQLEGNEACRVLSRRRRAVDDDHLTRRELKSEVEQLARVRRGVVNVGRRLEQGNAGYKQLYNQYKKMCDFIAMTVFE